MPQSHPQRDDDQRMADEVCQVWTRHGVIQEGERIDGFVSMVRAVGHHADGREYARVCRIVPPATCRADARDLLAEGLRMAPTPPAADDPA